MTATFALARSDEVVAHSEIIFVAVQTPHEARYEGVTRLPEERVDFDYTSLERPSERLRLGRAARARTGRRDHLDGPAGNDSA